MLAEPTDWKHIRLALGAAARAYGAAPLATRLVAAREALLSVEAYAGEAYADEVADERAAALADGEGDDLDKTVISPGDFEDQFGVVAEAAGGGLSKVGASSRTSRSTRLGARRAARNTDRVAGRLTRSARTRRARSIDA